jgi:hypothetical protein
LTHHRTIVLLLPALALFLLAPDRTPTQILPFLGGGQGGGSRSVISHRFLLTHTALLVVPLLLYLYLPLIAPTTPYTTLSLGETKQMVLYENSLQGFWRHIMGSVFSGELKPTAVGLDRLGLTWQLLRQQVGWVGVILALAGLITFWQRRQTPLLLLTGLGFIAFVAFNLIYFIGDVFVLFIPAWLFVCLWLGLGSLGLAHWLARRFVEGKTGSVNSSPGLEALEKRVGQRIYRFVAVTLAALGLLLPLVLLATRYPELDQSHNITARERWQAILAEPIPADAILLSNDRNEIMPLWYYQYVEGRQPDLLGLFPLIVPEPAYANVGRVLDQALASGRPVYLIKPMAGLALKADLSPAGSLFRARPNQAPPAHLLNLKLPEITLSASPSVTETITLLGYDLSPAKIHPGDPITVTLHWQTTQPLSLDYTSYVHLVSNNGQGLTQSDHRPGGDFYPSHYWQTGEIVRDQHLLAVPPTTPSGEYRLRVGMYDQPEPGVLKSMGAGVEIGTLLLE